MGEIDITGDRTISEQPYAGVLFKSQNASTWTADQYEDLKFAIYRADFNIATNSKLVLNNVALDRGNKGKILLGNDSIKTFSPELVLTTNSSNAPYTVGARLKQKTTLAEGTVTKVATVVVLFNQPLMIFLVVGQQEVQLQIELYLLKLLVH